MFRDLRHSERLKADDGVFPILNRLSNPVVPKNDVGKSRMSEKPLPLASCRSSSNSNEHWGNIGDAEQGATRIAPAEGVRAVFVLPRAEKIQIGNVVLDDRTVNLTACDGERRFLGAN